MTTSVAATPGAPAPPPRRPRVDRLTVLNWLAFLAILGMVLGEGCAMQAARRRDDRQARAAAARAAEQAQAAERALDVLATARAGCDPAAWGVGLVTGAPAASDSVARACARDVGRGGGAGAVRGAR